jgi:hypothetical protein
MNKLFDLNAREKTNRYICIYRWMLLWCLLYQSRGLLLHIKPLVLIMNVG